MSDAGDAPPPPLGPRTAATQVSAVVQHSGRRTAPYRGAPPPCRRRRRRRWVGGTDVAVVASLVGRFERTSASSNHRPSCLPSSHCSAGSRSATTGCGLRCSATSRSSGSPCYCQQVLTPVAKRRQSCSRPRRAAHVQARNRDNPARLYQ